MPVIRPYTTGHCLHLACMVEGGIRFAVRRFPARAYGITVANRLWLWDTGYSRHFKDCTAESVFRLYPLITPVRFESRDALAAQLERQGIAVRDVAGVILSHFHADHVAGVRDFAGVEMYCSEAAWAGIRGVSGFRALRRGFVPGLLPEDFPGRVRFTDDFAARKLPPELAPFTQGRELPGSDGHVFLVDLPGHARGHLGVFVNTGSGWVLLAGDAAWTPRNYTDLREPALPARFVMDDYTRYRQTLFDLHQLHTNGKVRIFLCHEEEQP